MEKNSYQRMVTQLACANLILEIETELSSQGVLKRNLKKQLDRTSKMIERELEYTITTLYKANEDNFTSLQNSIEDLSKDLASKSYHQIINKK